MNKRKKSHYATSVIVLLLVVQNIFMMSCSTRPLLNNDLAGAEIYHESDFANNDQDYISETDLNLCQELLSKEENHLEQKRDIASDRMIAAVRCEQLFASKVNQKKEPVKKLTPEELKAQTNKSWNESITALNEIDQAVYGRSQVIESMATAILAKEFVWMNGEPGGAKTLLSRMIFKSVLNTITEQEKKIFVLQFHKLIPEGKITGFQKFNKMMKEGKYEVGTETSLVGEDFLFAIFDEAEKANPATLNALLSILNERKAFLGSRVVESFLASGVFTSNKTTGEFIKGFHTDRPSGEALLDRMALKIHIPNQQMSSAETVLMYDLVKNPKKLNLQLPLMELQHLTEKIKISDEMMTEIVQIARSFDRYVINRNNESRQKVRYGEAENEYFPANQFSTRSVGRLIQVFKASLIAKQLMDGVPADQMRLQPNKSDLVLLAKSAMYIGPSQVKLKSFRVTEVKDNRITKNGVLLENDIGVRVQLQAEYSPYDGKLFLQDLQGQTQVTLKLQNKKWVVLSKSESFKEYDIDQKSFDALGDVLNNVVEGKYLTTQKIDLTKPEFEADTFGIDQLLAKGTVKDRTRIELESIKQDLNQFSDTLNQQMSKTSQYKTPVALAEKLLPPRSTKEIKAFQKEVMKLPEQEKIGRYFDWMTYEVRALKQRFVELEHSIEAHLTGMLSENHLYVFGPPGGAKTALAEVILKSELRQINLTQKNDFIQKILANPKFTHTKKGQAFTRLVLQQLRKESPKEFDRFLLQFHKLLPEGVLVGFPKIEKQLNDGVEEIETSTSLVSEKFIFAILDEVDKANPLTVTALLSILNEREVFAGNTVIKAALRTAILTSNKMPSEFLDSYAEDRTDGEAVMDRAINKVFVSNKIASEEALTKFLSNLEKGISPQWRGLLAISELKPVVSEITFENDVVKNILAEIHQKFLKERIKKEEDSHAAHKMDAREFPDYYVSASGSASDRTFIKDLDQFKARFIVHQLMNGIEFKNLRKTVTLSDVNLFFEGLGYWSPQKIISHKTKDGLVEFSSESTTLEKLISDGIVDNRVKYHLEQMIDEAKDFSKIATETVQDYMNQYQKQIAKHKDIIAFDIKDIRKLPLGEVVENLAKLYLQIEKQKQLGRPPLAIKALTEDYQKKEAQIKQEIIVNQKLLTAEAYQKLFKETIHDLQSGKSKADKENEERERKEKEEEEKKREKEKVAIEEATNPIHLAKKVIFHKIKHGVFDMGLKGSKTTQPIVKDFEMAQYQTTQMQYARLQILVGEKDIDLITPSHFKDKAASVVIEIAGHKLQMQPDHPVERVSHNNITDLLKKVNHKSIHGTDAEQAELAKIIPGHKRGHIYDLPTQEQWEYVMRNLGKANGEWFDKDDASELNKYSWYNENSGGETHAVGTKDPRMIDGQPFNDLEGNVWEWTNSVTGSNRFVRGGSWFGHSLGLHSGDSDSNSPGARSKFIGFRLLRTGP